MKHKTIEAATTTTTDQGQFSAIAAAYSVDRVKDRIVPGAFEKTIGAWQASGRPLPLHWDHSPDPHDIIGTVDATSMKELEAGLYVEGQLDLEKSEVAREAWRSIKNNALALSFGYLATKQKRNRDGINELHELDLFEVSVVPAPANPDTRFLSTKNAEEETAVEDEATRTREGKSASQDSLRRRSDDLLLDLSSDGLSKRRYVEPDQPAPPEPLDERELKRRWNAARLDIASS